ncbi:MAG: hypothetical protein VB104_04145 [Candidatus Limiplasma sp.]|nr:hypothetical protein [Candidatus Limiplasma sp.]
MDTQTSQRQEQEEALAAITRSLSDADLRRVYVVARTLEQMQKERQATNAPT